MLKRRFLRYGQLWTTLLKPYFREEPPVPSKEALAYHALFSTASDRSAKKVRSMAKGSFRKLVTEKVEKLYESWNRTQGDLRYGVKEAVDIAFKAVEEAWAKAFPPSGPPTLMDGEVELRRKFLAVDPELAARFTATAKEKGVKITALTRDAVEQELAAATHGITLRQTLDFYETVMLCSNYGLNLIPMEPFNRILERFRPEELEALAEDCRSSGTTLGRYLRARGEDEALKLLKCIFQTGIFRVTNLDISRRERLLEVRCVSPTLTNENTKLLTAILEGVVEGIGFKVTERDCMRGIINLTAGKEVAKQ